MLSAQAHINANAFLSVCVLVYMNLFPLFVTVGVNPKISSKKRDLDIINPLKPAEICVAKVAQPSICSTCQHGAAPYVKVGRLMEGDIVESLQRVKLAAHKAGALRNDR